MKGYMQECYSGYCSDCFSKNEEPKASFKDYVYIQFGAEAYYKEFKESYQGEYL